MRSRSTYPASENSGFRREAMLGGLRLGKIADVGVYVHWSILVIFTLILLSLGGAVFPNWHPEWTPLVTWTTALLASVSFFASIVAHEMSHALVARTQGIPVPRLTLFLFGGMAEIERPPQTPKGEFFMAIAGPLMSVLIGVVALVGGFWIAGIDSTASTLEDPEAVLAALSPTATLLLWLGPINIALALFNLIPGFPLDGGRVLRASLWAITGDRLKASRWATRSGQVVSWVLIGLGILSAIGGSLLQGVWLVLIGSFLGGAARANYRQEVAQDALGSMQVKDIMRVKVESVLATSSVRALVVEHIFVSAQRAFPVLGRDGMLGIVSFSDVRRVPHDRWDQTLVTEIMTPVDRVVVLPLEASAQTALELLTTHKINQIPVVMDGRVVGLVLFSDLQTWITLRGSE